MNLLKRRKTKFSKYSILPADCKKYICFSKINQCKYVFLYSLNETHKNAREPKFLVFYSFLMTLFSFFCFKCKVAKLSVVSLKNGSMITVLQHCPNCGNNAFKWSSQPLMFGKFPAGNILLSLGVLVAGASIGKVLLVFKHFGMAAHDVRTFFRHQSEFVLQSIPKYWEESRSSAINQIKVLKMLRGVVMAELNLWVIVPNMVYTPCFARH